jgi:hypothetical protein
MTLNVLLIFACMAAMVFTFKQTGQISVQAALAHLKNGVQLLDVRSPGEYNSSHLPQAMNIPLGEMQIGVSGRLEAKSGASVALFEWHAQWHGKTKIETNGLSECP